MFRGRLRLLVVGVIATQTVLALGVVVSVVGFLVMVAAVGLFMFGQPGGSRPSSPGEGTRTHSSLSDRMEERFRRRFDEQN